MKKNNSEKNESKAVGSNSLQSAAYQSSVTINCNFYLFIMHKLTSLLFHYLHQHFELARIWTRDSSKWYAYNPKGPVSLLTHQMTMSDRKYCELRSNKTLLSFKNKLLSQKYFEDCFVFSIEWWTCLAMCVCVMARFVRLVSSWSITQESNPIKNIKMTWNSSHSLTTFWRFSYSFVSYQSK